MIYESNTSTQQASVIQSILQAKSNIHLSLPPHTNTSYGTTTSTESTTTSTLTSPSFTKTDFSTTINNTIKKLIVNCNHKHSKQDAKFKKPLYTKMEHLMQNLKNSYRPCHFILNKIISSFH